MRLILMVVVLLIVGLLLYRQMGEIQRPADASPAIGTDRPVPRVPQRVQELPAFEQQMQGFLLESAEERRRQIDALEP
jgi:hypothetical protein